jgi:hypothetical protein
MTARRSVPRCDPLARGDDRGEIMIKPRGAKATAITICRSPEHAGEHNAQNR